MKHNIINLLTVAVVAVLMSSCSSVKNISYIQDKLLNNPEKLDAHAGIVVQPKDMLSIVVSSRNPELTSMFNLPLVSYMAGSEIVGSGGQQRIMGYVVDNEGCIDFPILGKLKIAGMTRWEVSDNIKSRLLKEGYLNDAVVTVEFMNFKVSVMGEVNAPGTYSVDGDKVTILQALSLARDLTIFGKRENVAVIRELNGVRTIYNINLCSVDLFKSPAYYLQQNDIVYVEPNPIKARQSTMDDKTMRVTSIALSSTSVLVSVASLVATLVLNGRRTK